MIYVEPEPEEEENQVELGKEEEEEEKKKSAVRFYCDDVFFCALPLVVSRRKIVSRWYMCLRCRRQWSASFTID